MTSRRRASLRSRLIRVLIYLMLTIFSGWRALVLFDASAPEQRATGNDVTPDMLLLTSQRSVTLNVTIRYYQWHKSDAEGLIYGPPSGSLPTGSREIQIQFLGGKPNSLLQYSVLLGRNGAENNPVGQQNEPVFSGNPGGTYTSDCVAPQIAGVVQVLYGKVRLNPQGQATIITVGTLVNQHAYLENGATDVVGVIDVNSPITALSPSGPESTCIFPDWPYLGGVLWYSPAAIGGQVSIGQVSDNYDVTSSNPSLVDLSTLSWQINGPASISYTLTDKNIVHRQLTESFIAGVIAALAAALAVEAAKSAVGKASESDGEDENAESVSPDYADRHPVLTGALVLTAVIAAVRGRRQQ